MKQGPGPRTAGWRVLSRTGLVALAALALGACRPGATPAAQAPAAESPALYALAGAPGAATLVSLAAEGGEPLARVGLKLPGASALAVDRDGRAWVGGQSVTGRPLTSISVVSADRKDQRWVTTAENPGAGVAFAANKVWVAATRQGFGGTVTEIDPESLATRSMDIAAPEGKSLILTALAASDSRIIVAGMTNGPDARKRYAQVVAIDPASLQITWRSALLPDADIWQILPKGDAFVLLNVASAQAPDATRADIWTLGADNRLTPAQTLASPLWGTLHKGVLYSYHNPTWNALEGAPQRHLSMHDLRSGNTRSVRLPDGTNAMDIAVAGGKLMLSVRATSDGTPTGVYALDLDGRNLQLWSALDAPGKLSVAEAAR